MSVARVRAEHRRAAVGRVRDDARGPAPDRAAAAVALALVTAAAVLLAGAAQVAGRAGGPLGHRADLAGVSRLEGTVLHGTARLAPAWPGAPQRARATLRVERVSTAEGTVAVDAPVVVVGPASWLEVPVGTRVAVQGAVSRGDAGERAVAVVSTQAAPEPTARPAAWWVVPDAVRSTVARQSAALPGDAAALLPGVTIGDTRGVPDDLRDALRVAGLTHLTAVSGAHFALVGALVLAGAGAVGVPRRGQAVTVLAVGACLVLLVGASPSVVRAAGMGLVAVAGLLVGRPSRSPAALAAAVVGLLVVDPWQARELGFVLSVVATAGLVLLGVPLADRWRDVLPHPVATALAAPLAAQLVCAPVLLLLDPDVAVLAVPANLLAAPAVAPATVVGLAGALVGTLCPPLGHVAAAVAGAACWWIGAVARTVAALPGAQVSWLPGAVGALLLAGAGAALARLAWPAHAARGGRPDGT
ncbi:ComEC/Rec2 family competence protein [Cellulomonas fimi]|uniref:ComEC/Rec2 family competence protein n=1 Tax=Cellulomonas fimi TaxID=1708 RepID=UPI0012F7491A|nr:ComEC/Rec2 family competence protein [Cellulomonas fimi]NNH08251.1 ComEC/Rec2 family competence protein [Cellulomonas fimi]